MTRVRRLGPGQYLARCRLIERHLCPCPCLNLATIRMSAWLNHIIEGFDQASLRRDWQFATDTLAREVRITTQSSAGWMRKPTAKWGDRELKSWQSATRSSPRSATRQLSSVPDGRLQAPLLHTCVIQNRPIIQIGARSGVNAQPVSRTHILLVEPDDAARIVLYTAASGLAQVESHRRFETARARVSLGAFDFLLTNVRLDAFNGLHLVYLRPPGLGASRAIVYSAERDPGLARQAQRAGAFYETRECLPVTLGAYLGGTLPPRDRRDSVSLDRRGVFRGGRRSWDRHLVRQVH